MGKFGFFFIETMVQSVESMVQPKFAKIYCILNHGVFHWQIYCLVQSMAQSPLQPTGSRLRQAFAGDSEVAVGQRGHRTRRMLKLVWLPPFKVSPEGKRKLGFRSKLNETN